MKKRLGTVITALAALSLCSMTALAAPEVKEDGTIFDAVYYAAKNPDVVLIYGLDPDMLYLHYTTYGRSEGRATFDPASLPGVMAGAVPQAVSAVPTASGTYMPVPVSGTTIYNTDQLPESEFANYKFTFLNGAPQTKAAWLAELIDNARINNKTDKYIWGYPFEWDPGLAKAAQMQAEEYVYSRTNERAVTQGAWAGQVPQKFRANLVQILVNGGGNAEGIVGYWTAYQDPRRVTKEDGETVMEEGRYIHPSSDLNKIFDHNARYIGAGHVASDKYNMKDYWVVLLSQ
ncbi:MAG: hypothetical protein IJU50_03955 [Lachnospiraceae bacterium]|nr:hypothetical protein [Lachnospiraceae bacterium]